MMRTQEIKGIRFLHNGVPGIKIIGHGDRVNDTNDGQEEDEPRFWRKVFQGYLLSKNLEIFFAFGLFLGQFFLPGMADAVGCPFFRCSIGAVCI